MTPLVAACLASLGTMAAVAHSERLPQGQADLFPAPQPCRVAIVLVAADDSAVAQTIDRLTGGLGFSHAYLDPCRVDERGQRRIIGYTVAAGVHWADPATYKSDRAHVRIELDERTSAEIWGCVRARLGRPLRVSAIALGIDSAATCVGLLVGCLPWAMQERLRAVQVGPCISPNTLAAFFGVAG